jgi:hypothetical protein
MAPHGGHLHFGPCTCKPNAEKRCLTVIYERISTSANTDTSTARLAACSHLYCLVHNIEKVAHCS